MESADPRLHGIARELAGFMWAVANEGFRYSSHFNTIACMGGGGTTAGESPSAALWPVKDRRPQ
jgi:hypothetical protein